MVSSTNVISLLALSFVLGGYSFRFGVSPKYVHRRKSYGIFQDGAESGFSLVCLWLILYGNGQIHTAKDFNVQPKNIWLCICNLWIFSNSLFLYLDFNKRTNGTGLATRFFFVLKKHPSRSGCSQGVLVNAQNK